MGKGGGGGGAPTQSTAYQTNVPEYAKPYVTNMLESTQKQLFNTQAGPEGTTEITGFKPYTPYSSNVNDYVAGFSPMQEQAQRGIMGLQVPGQYGAATNLTNQAAAGSLGAADQAGNLQNQALGYGAAGAQYGGAGAQYGSAGAQQAQQAAALTAAQAGQYGAQGAQAGQQAGNLSDVYGGLGSQAGQTAAGQSGMYGNLGAQSGQQYAGQSSGYGGMGAGYGAQGSQIGQSLGQMSQDPNAVQNYMNPYLQASLNPQLAEIQRQYDITGTQQRSGAAKSGAFGGSREALMSAENQRNAGLAKNQLIGQGYNQAFQQAQQQMNAANQAALSGNAQAMQGAGIGLQGAGQAGSQALAGYGMGLQGAGQAGSQAMQGYGMGLTGANQAGNLRMQGAQAGLQGVGAQQAAANLGLAGTAQGMQGAGMGMQGAQAGMQGVQGAIGAGQYGLSGYGQAGQMAGQLAGIGGQQLGAQQGIYGLQSQIGGQQQAQEQQKINQAIQDYATQQQYPMMQLGLMSNMLRGLPMQATNVQSYQAQAPLAQQTAGLLGAYNAYSGGRKAGGVIRDYKKGGVTRGIPGYKSGVLVGLEDDIGDISQMDSYAPPMQRQLPKLAQQTSSPGLKQMIGAQQAEDAMGQQMAGVAAAPTGGLGMNMAEGGIVPRFAEGDLITEPPGAPKEYGGIPSPYASVDDYFAQKIVAEDKAVKAREERLTPAQKKARERVAERLSSLDLETNEARRMNKAMAFLEAGSTVGGLGAAAIAGGKKYMLGEAEIKKNYNNMQDNLIKAQAEQDTAMRKDAEGDVKGAFAASEKAAEFKQKAENDKRTADFAEKRLTSEETMAEARNKASIRAAQIGAMIKPTEAERLRKDVEAANKADPTGKTAAEIIRVAELATAALTTKDSDTATRARVEASKQVDALLAPGGGPESTYYRELLKTDKTAAAKYKEDLILGRANSFIGSNKPTTAAAPAANKGKVDLSHPLLSGKS